MSPARINNLIALSMIFGTGFLFIVVGIIYIIGFQYIIFQNGTYIEFALKLEYIGIPIGLFFALVLPLIYYVSGFYEKFQND